MDKLIEEAEIFTFMESNCEYVLLEDYRALVDRLKAADEVIKITNMEYKGKKPHTVSVCSTFDIETPQDVENTFCLEITTALAKYQRIKEGL